MKKIFIFLAITTTLTFANRVEFECGDTGKWAISNDTLYTNICWDSDCQWSVAERLDKGNVINPDHLIYADTTKLIYETNYVVQCKPIHKKNKHKKK